MEDQPQSQRCRFKSATSYVLQAANPYSNRTLASCSITRASSMRSEWATRFSLQNLRPLASLFSEDLAIDLGTVNTRVYARGRGIVVNEPSAVALDDSTGEVQAVGKEAREMLGRTPSKIRVVKPLKDGVIADFRVC